MMSSASSSASTMCSWEYDVFISFRGEDTRMGFISHLYTALTDKGIRTFKDDKKLEIGNTIATELLRAIEKSRFAVVVLSRKFATSKWCLEEVAKVVQCRKKRRLIVIPVFYHVKPSEVRHQTASFEQSFANHERDPEIMPEKVQTWRDALKNIGHISGDHVTKHKDESEVVNQIVRKIFKEIQDTLPTDITNGLVGTESRVNEVKRLLSLQSSEVHFIGICGMSGMGKTTLAEVVYNGIKDDFQRSSFIENIKDVSKKNGSTNLCKLQQKLLDDILKDNIHVDSVTHGQTLLGTILRGMKVIIVLDDVNHLDQLTYLAGNREWFGPGSRIIITTTNKDLLDPHIINEIYTCIELKCDEALKLFCQSAFKKGHPTHGYEKLSRDIVELAGGLPLALNVYGSLLCGKEEDYWKEMLKKLGEYPHKEILGRLEVVYARLDRDQRNTFIYIACFLKGKSIHLVKAILTSIRLYPECGITDLTNKFLININHDDSVWVHDLLQQMCWEVLRKESERHSGKHIAIKYRQDVEYILSCEPKGTRTIEIINQEPYKVEGDDFFDDHNCFSKMMKLKFLRISKIDFHQGLDHLSNDLRILEWYGCSLKSLPSTFKPRHIFELEMCYSQLETLWEQDLDLPNLRSINLSFSENLTKIPDLTSTPNLEKLNLEGCKKLKELHESVLLQKKLRYMNAQGCTSLQSLGRRTMEMEALEALLLSGCTNLEYLPKFGQNMKRLEHLYVNGTNIEKLPDNLGEMCDLRKLDVSRTCIEELPSSIHHLKRLRLLCVHGCPRLSKTRGFLYTDLDTLSSGLRELDLSYCNLSRVPDGIGLLYRLISLDMSGNDFVSLPASISLLSNLKMLCLNNCKRLQTLPKLSIVNEDTLYGLQIRFNYHISGERLDFSKLHATSNSTGPTVSCLNCPKLAENGIGSYIAEKILKSYLQLRTKYWITPEAVFEIVGAGNQIPLWFNLLQSDDLILKGPWIGVAICTVIAVDDIGALIESKYVVTAHIHLGERHWTVPVHVNYILVARLETQLVFYWTVVDDLQRLVYSNQTNNFGVSFSVQPRDGKLQVTKFGIRFIYDEDIWQLKRYDHYKSEAVNILQKAYSSLPLNLDRYLLAWEADMDLYSSHSIIHAHSSGIIKFILDYGNQRDSLNQIQKISKCLVEINKEAFMVLNEFKEEWRHTYLFPLFNCYHEINLGISLLYDDFIGLLKDISDSWLSVKLALEQIVIRNRAEDYTYQEMLQQLNDLEAADCVRFSHSHVKSFAYTFDQTVGLFKRLDEDIEELKSVKVLGKLSSTIIAGVFSVIAAFWFDTEVLQEMKDMPLSSMQRYLVYKLPPKGSRTWMSHDLMLSTELRIWDFNGNAILLQELKNKMARFSSFTNQSEEEMMIVIDKLEKKVDNLSKTIEDMSSITQNYSDDIRQARVALEIDHEHMEASHKLLVKRKR